MYSTSCRAIPIALGLLLGLLLCPAPALARPGGDKAAADAAFREGRELMSKGAYAEACPRFEDALARYESPSAALNLGRCYAKTGRLVAAQTTLERAIELNRRTDDAKRRKEIARLANEDLLALEDRVSHIRIRVTPAVAGTVVVQNGVELPAGVLDRTLAIDPGPVSLRVTAPGYPETVRTATIAEGKTEIVEIALSRDPAAAAGQGAEATPAQGGRPAAIAPDASSPALWPWLVGGAGVVSVGVGIGFAVDYAMARDEVDTLCPNGTCPRSRVAQADEATARWDRDLALMTSFGGAGVGLLVTSAIGLALGSEPARAVSVVPRISRDVASLTITTTIE